METPKGDDNPSRSPGFTGLSKITATTDHFKSFLPSPSADDYFGLQPHPGSTAGTSRKRARISNVSLERQLQAKLEEQRLVSSHELKKCESKLRQSEIRVEHLEKEVERVCKDEENATKELREKEIEFLQEKHVLQAKVHALEKELRTSRGDIDAEREAAETAITELEKQNEELRLKGSVYAKQVATLEEELQSLSQSNRPNQQVSVEEGGLSQVEAMDLRATANRLKRDNYDLQLKLDSFTNGILVTDKLKQLSEELTESQQRCRRFQAELRLAAASSDKLLEKEQIISDLEGKLKRLEKTNDRLLSAEVERDELVAKRREWGKRFSQVLASASGNENYTGEELDWSDMFESFQALQRKYLYLSRSKGTLDSRVQTKERELSSLKEELRKLSSSNEKVKLKLATVSDENQALSNKSQFLEKERDSLLRVIESVGKETHLTVDAGKQAASSDEVHVDTLKAALKRANKRISELERKESSLLRVSSPAVLKRTQKAQSRLESQIQELEQSNNKLRIKLEKAQDKIAELEHHVTRGSHDPSTTKILHMSFNPHRASREAKAKSVEEEIALLKRQNAELAEKLLTATGDDPDVRSMAMALQLQNQKPDKRNERLKALFKQRTWAFREAVHLLTGYKIDMTLDKNPMLRLRSVFAEREEDHLLFRYQPDVGGLTLEDTEFSSRVDEHIMSYLTKCQSVPAFLSLLTMDLYEKQTFLIPT